MNVTQTNLESENITRTGKTQKNSIMHQTNTEMIYIASQHDPNQKIQNTHGIIST